MAPEELKSFLYQNLLHYLKQFHFWGGHLTRNCTDPSKKFLSVLQECAAWITGSALIQVALQEDHPYSDLDIVCQFDRKETLRTFLQASGYLESFKSLEELRYQPTDVLAWFRYSKPGVSKRINLILVGTKAELSSVIEDFGVWCLNSDGGGAFYGLDQLAQIRRRILRLNPEKQEPRRLSSVLRRIGEYLKCGFTFSNLLEALGTYQNYLLTQEVEPVASQLLNDLLTPGKYSFDPRHVVRVDSRWKPFPKEMQILTIATGVVTLTPPEELKASDLPTPSPSKRDNPVPDNIQPPSFDLSALKRYDFLPDADALRLLYCLQNWNTACLARVGDLTQFSLSYYQNWNRAAEIDSWKSSQWGVLDLPLLKNGKMYISVHGGSPILITGLQEFLTPQDVLDAVKGVKGRLSVDHLIQYTYKGLPLLALE